MGQIALVDDYNRRDGCDPGCGHESRNGQRKDRNRRRRRRAPPRLHDDPQGLVEQNDGAGDGDCGGVTCQFIKTKDPNNATPRATAVAIAVDRQAIARRKAGSVPCVNLSKGRIAFSGPRVRKYRMAISGKVNWNSIRSLLSVSLSQSGPSYSASKANFVPVGDAIACASSVTMTTTRWISSGRLCLCRADERPRLSATTS
jgi:hypothetical protein